MNIFTTLQIVISLLLIISVIMQSRGTQAGITFGGAGETFRSKRGLEKFLFYGTVVLGALFAAVSILSLLSK